MQDINFSILIVDDIPKNIQFAAQILMREGYNVSFAQSGQEALDIIKNASFDIILLDVMMPVMDGFEVCRLLKSDEATADIPIIFLTARSDTDSIIEGFNHGGVDYIVKPFEVRELVARVKTHINLKYLQVTQAKQEAEIERLKNVELSAVNEQLRSLNREKNEFISMVAHDLKNPLSSLRLIGKTFVEEELSPEDYKEFGGDVLTLATQMFEMVTNFLDFHKIEHHEVKPNFAEAQLSDIFTPLLYLYHQKAALKQQSIVTNIDEAAYITTDLLILRQILDNLVSNAIKYSPLNTQVTVSAEKSHKSLFDADDFNDAPFDGVEYEFVWKISVKDQGPGFSDDDKKKMFQKFTRLSAQPTGGEHSSGVGLSIVQRLVNMLGGHILCNSTLGEGAEFVVLLPEPNMESTS